MKQLFLLAIAVFLFLSDATATTNSGQDFEDRALARAPLFDAIEAGDEKKVVEILRKPRHVNLNHRELWDGDTFLIEAIRAKQTEIVRILLAHGADPNLREIIGLGDHEERLLGNTPLAAALEEDSVEIVRLLIQHGVKLREHAYALHSSTSIAMVRFLLDHGAPINGRDDDGATYLQTAANRPQLQDVAKLLIERGAKVNLADKGGATPLLRVESIGVARLLIGKGANVNAADHEGLTPLHLAAFEASRIELAKLLVLSGADVNAKNNEGYTPLDFLVADSFDYEFALFLVAHGARVDENLVKRYGLEKEFEKIRTALKN
jgi:ankyrin repeat protein